MSQLFAITARDAPGSAERRAVSRAAHDAHIDALGDAVALGAALTAADGSPAGSLMILRASDEATARAVVAADPFVITGVWESFEIRMLVPRTGSWIGGRQA